MCLLRAIKGFITEWRITKAFEGSSPVTCLILNRYHHIDENLQKGTDHIMHTCTERVGAVEVRGRF